MLAEPVTRCESCPLGRAGSRCPFTPSQIPSGAVVCAQGEVHPVTYFIREGVVTLCTVDSGGTERSLALRGPRSLLCLEAVLGQPSPYELRALTPLRLCAIPVGALGPWVGPELSPSRVMLSLLLEELRSRQEDAGWKRGGSVSRVARFLLSWGLQPTGLRNLEKQLIARMLGMRAETFSRCLSRLSARGLISRVGDRVLDEAGLWEVAQEEA